MEEQEAALWSRVAGSQGADRGPIGPELQAIGGELRELQGQYRALLALVSGTAAKTLRTQQVRVQRVQMGLTGLCYFLGEQPPAYPEPAAPGRQLPAQRLRQLIRQTELECGRLEALSHRATGIAAETLESLSAQLQETLLPLLFTLGGMA